MVRGGVVRGAAVRASYGAIDTTPYTHLHAECAAAAEVAGTLSWYSLYAAPTAVATAGVHLQTTARFTAAIAAQGAILGDVTAKIKLAAALESAFAAAASLTSGIRLAGTCAAQPAVSSPLTTQIVLAAAPALSFSATARIRSLPRATPSVPQLFILQHPDEYYALVTP